MRSARTGTDGDAAPPTRRLFLAGMGAGVGTAAAVALTSTSAAAHAPASETFDIRSYSPGSDAAPAINAAIVAANAAGGGTVYVPNGTWNCASSIAMKSNVTLRGVSPGVSVIRRDLTTQHLIVHDAGCTGSTIENLTIDGNTQPAAGGQGIRFASGASYCSVRQVVIRNTRQDGIKVVTGNFERLYFQNISLENIGTHGIDFVPASAASVFLTEIGITGFGAGVGTACYGIHLTARAHMSDISIAPVDAGDTAVLFDTGSANSTLSNYYIKVGSGTSLGGAAVASVFTGVGAVEP